MNLTVNDVLWSNWIYSSLRTISSSNYLTHRLTVTTLCPIIGKLTVPVSEYLHDTYQLWHKYWTMTDRQTDRQTDVYRQHSLCYLYTRALATHYTALWAVTLARLEMLSHHGLGKNSWPETIFTNRSSSEVLHTVTQSKLVVSWPTIISQPCFVRALPHFHHVCCTYRLSFKDDTLIAML